MSSSRPILETKNLRKEFGNLTAVDGVDLEIPPNQTIAIIGPNGAGKTTFFNLLSGTLKPSGGTVLFKGTDVTGEPPYVVSRLGLSRSFQTPNISTDLTVKENVQLGIQYREASPLSPSFYIRNASHDDTVTGEAERILRELNLDHVTEKVAGELTLGEKKKLELCMTLSTDPDAILLDEPTAGLNSQERRSFVEDIEESTQEKTLVIIEHNIEVVSNLADRIVVLHNGKVLADGEIDAIKSNQQVQDVYLGES